MARRSGLKAKLDIRRMRKDLLATTKALSNIDWEKLEGNPEMKKVAEELTDRFSMLMLDILLPHMEKATKSPEVVETIIQSPLLSLFRDLHKKSGDMRRLVAVRRLDTILASVVALLTTVVAICLIVDLLQTKVMGSGLELRAFSFMLPSLIPIHALTAGMADGFMRPAFIKPFQTWMNMTFPHAVPTEYQMTKFFYERHINFDTAVEWGTMHGHTKEFAKKWIKIVEREPTRAEIERFVTWGLTPIDETPEDPLKYRAPRVVDQLLKEVRPEYDRIFGQGRLDKAIDLGVALMSKMRVSPARCKLYLASMWRYPSVFYMRWLMQRKQIAATRIEKWLIRSRYHPAVAKILAEALSDEIVYDEMKTFGTELMRWRERGYGTKQQLEADLKKLDLADREIEIRVSKAELAMQRRVMELKVDTYIEQYREGVIIESEDLFKKLVEAGVDRLVANWMVQYERARKGLPIEEYVS